MLFLEKGGWDKLKNQATKKEKIPFKQKYGVPIKFLWQYIKKYKSTFIVVVISSIIAALFVAGVTIGNYYLMKTITKYFDQGKTDQNNSNILYFFIMLIFVLIISLFFYIVQTSLMTYVAQYASKALRKDLYFKLLQLRLQYFDSTPSGDIMSRLTNDINNITTMLTQNITQFFSLTTQMILFTIVLLLFSPILSLVIFVIVPIQLIVIFIFYKKAQPNFIKKQVSLGDLNGFVEETISGQKVINNFNKQELFVSRFSTKNNEIKRISYVSDLLSTLTNPWNTLMGNISVAIMFILAMIFSINNFDYGGIVSTVTNGKTDMALTMSLLTAILTFSRNITNPIYQMFQLLTLLQSAMAGTSRVMEIKAKENEVLPEETVDVKNLKGHVEFKNLSFAYVPGRTILKNVSLDIKEGQVVGIVGPTGSGKTTIINLLTKFYDVTNEESDILIDGQSIKQITKHSLRNEVSIVLQDTFVFGVSIYENLRYAKPNATNEEIEEAAIKANAHPFIMSLEKGYETILENNADDISQGQKQLLAIARAFLKESNILILDEATSSIDTKTEKDIQSAMIRLSKGKTTFMIAHRLSTIKHADIIVVLKDGQILEKGNHNQLLKLNGFYANMYNSKLNIPEDV